MKIHSVIETKDHLHFTNNKEEYLHKKNNSSYKSRKTLLLAGSLIGLGVAGLVIAGRYKTRSIKPEIYDDTLYTFNALLKKLEENGINRAEAILSNCISQNKIGSGANSSVYKFSNEQMRNWVIKVHKSITTPAEVKNLEIKPVLDELTGMNFGQPIAEIGGGIQILKRVNGTAHSIENWSKRKEEHLPPTKIETEKFLNDIKRIASFPQAAFDDLAKQLEILNTKGYKVDSFNPNNLLVDFERSQLHIIDFYKYEPDANKNTVYDLIGLLTDYANLEIHYNNLRDGQKQQLIDTTKLLFEKCTIGATKHNVNQSEKVFENYVAEIDIREKCANMYQQSFHYLKNLCALNTKP